MELVVRLTCRPKLAPVRRYLDGRPWVLLGPEGDWPRGSDSVSAAPETVLSVDLVHSPAQRLK